LLKSGTVDFELLDRGIDAVVTKLLYTMPDCTLKTLESLRKKKLEHWDQNRETNRAWLSLNMMTEARAGFQAFHRGSREVGREVDFVDLRCRLAGGEQWGDDLVRAVSPQFKTGS
jgi:6-oxo-cyclohex-1-ene-carbonyl-CoA hydrolase